jgi:hypothetical protein
MAYWEFLDYITEDYCNPVQDWWGTLEPQAQADFDLLVVALSETEDWDEVKERKRKYKELVRFYPGMYELIFKVGRKNFRPLGILRRSERQFVFLGGCEKHPFWTVPPNAFESAYKLKGQFDLGRGTTRAHV